MLGAGSYLCSQNYSLFHFASFFPSNWIIFIRKSLALAFNNEIKNKLTYEHIMLITTSYLELISYSFSFEIHISLSTDTEKRKKKQTFSRKYGEQFFNNNLPGFSCPFLVVLTTDHPALNENILSPTGVI